MNGNQQDSVIDQGLSGSKPLWQSTTFIGVIIMVLAQVAAIFGYQVSPDDITAITGNADQLVAGLVTAIGAIVAIWGRVRATKRIGGNSGTSQ